MKFIKRLTVLLIMSGCLFGLHAQDELFEKNIAIESDAVGMVLAKQNASYYYYMNAVEPFFQKRMNMYLQIIDDVERKLALIHAMESTLSEVEALYNVTINDEKGKLVQSAKTASALVIQNQLGEYLTDYGADQLADVFNLIVYDVGVSLLEFDAQQAQIAARKAFIRKITESGINIGALGVVVVNNNKIDNEIAAKNFLEAYYKNAQSLEKISTLYFPEETKPVYAIFLDDLTWSIQEFFLATKGIAPSAESVDRIYATIGDVESYIDIMYLLYRFNNKQKFNDSYISKHHLLHKTEKLLSNGIVSEIFGIDLENKADKYYAKNAVSSYHFFNLLLMINNRFHNDPVSSEGELATVLGYTYDVSRDSKIESMGALKALDNLYKRLFGELYYSTISSAKFRKLGWKYYQYIRPNLPDTVTMTERLLLMRLCRVQLFNLGQAADIKGVVVTQGKTIRLVHRLYFEAKEYFEKENK